MVLTFTIPGPPRPKERARKGAGGRFYTPAKTRAYEKRVAMCALAARQKCAWRWPLDARYRVVLQVEQADARRIDLDNCIKSCLDGCNGVLWRDDAQVDEIHAYRKLVERPCVVVRVEVLR